MSKEQYRINRFKGIRGQGSYPNLVVGYRKPEEVKQGRVKSRGYLRASGKDELTLRLFEAGEI